MDRDEAEKIVAAYDQLLEKALTLLNEEGPPHGYVSETRFARLSFDGDDAVVIDPCASTYYDSVTIEEDEARFPASLLFMEPEDLAKWKAEAVAESERKEQQRRREYWATREMAERTMLANLKAKYG